MTERPLTSDNKELWRKYAESLEARIAELERYPGVTLWGIPLVEDATMEPGAAELRWKGQVYGRVDGLYFLGHNPLPGVDFSDHATLRVVEPDAAKLLRAVHEVRAGFFIEPDEIRIHLVPKERDE